MPKAVVICGVVGPVELSVTRSLSREYAVTVVTSNVVKLLATPDTIYGAVEVKSLRCEDLGQVLSGAEVVFVKTESDNAREDGIHDEIRTGEAIANACVKCGVQHVVFSTQLSVIETTGMTARHMDAKAKIENYMRRQGLNVTGIIVPCLYEQFLEPPLLPTKTATNQYYLDIPMGQTLLDLISADDIGDLVLSLFQNRTAYLKKTISVGADRLMVKEIAAALSRQLAPKQFVDKQFTLNQYRQKQHPGIDDLASMFDFYCRMDQRINPNLTRSLNPNTVKFEQWLQTNKERAHRAMEYEVKQKPDPWL